MHDDPSPGFRAIKFQNILKHS